VRVMRCGVCHTDLHLWEGYFDWWRQEIPHQGPRARCAIPSGTSLRRVEAAGPTQTSRSAQRHRLSWIGCGACAVCRGRPGQLLSRAALHRAGKPAPTRRISWCRTRGISSRPRVWIRLCGDARLLGPHRLQRRQEAAAAAADDWVAVIAAGPRLIGIASSRS